MVLGENVVVDDNKEDRLPSQDPETQVLKAQSALERSLH